MLVNRRAADRLQRALEGGEATDAETARLTRTAQALASVPVGAGAPRPEFVEQLHERLMAEAATLPVAARSAGARRTESTVRRGGPVVVVVGRGLPRALAGAAASALVVGAVVGVASRSAIPGSALYPVKGWLDSVAVQMAGSELDRGRTHLAQAEEHIADTRELTDRRVEDADPYIEALQQAVLAVRAAQSELGRAYDETGNPQALIALRDFTSRAEPQVEALRPEVPAEALPVLGELESLLNDTEQAALRRLASCAPTCVTLQEIGVSPSDLPSLGAPAAGSSTLSRAVGGITVPGTAITADPGGGQPAPGVTAGSDGVTIGDGGGGATLSTNGAGINGPTLSASATRLPGVSATLPSVGVTSDGAGATVPDTTLGSVTLPGLTATVPLP
ncbi:DUF5667 domain-containing protein [Knoellia sp. p5-6-4]|uniref:DUF5667 domain-containing protein n=1 Tax=unclassified Knoellia TaxID=2618719 RepID=UPI0023DCC7EC|nr:DUF5667 domain-containing protein [Knoellia sp. p5-6-4]MDF2144565.1 DUF5667 domain-containing protein [Knoellia sp. p5-6-4]